MSLSKIEAEQLESLSLDEFRTFMSSKCKSITQTNVYANRTLLYYIRNDIHKVVYALETLSCVCEFNIHMQHNEIFAKSHPMYMFNNIRVLHLLLRGCYMDIYIMRELLYNRRTHAMYDRSVIQHTMERCINSVQRVENRYHILSTAIGINSMKYIMKCIDGDHEEKFDFMLERNNVSVWSVNYVCTIANTTSLDFITNNPQRLDWLIEILLGSGTSERYIVDTFVRLITLSDSDNHRKLITSGKLFNDIILKINIVIDSSYYTPPYNCAKLLDIMLSMYQCDFTSLFKNTTFLTCNIDVINVLLDRNAVKLPDDYIFRYIQTMLGDINYGPPKYIIDQEIFLVDKLIERTNLPVINHVYIDQVVKLIKSDPMSGEIISRYPTYLSSKVIDLFTKYIDNLSVNTITRLNSAMMRSEHPLLRDAMCRFMQKNKDR